MQSNFQAALDFVWQPQFDSPAQGYHDTPGDAGGGTLGGITEATWAFATSGRLVTGPLSAASREQLSTVLQALFWGNVCDDLPAGLDLLVFNGRVMSGEFPKLFQQCLGRIGAAVDGWIGPDTLGLAAAAHVPTLIDAVTGVHHAYLTRLPAWGKFGDGWTDRLREAQVAALMLAVEPVVALA